MKPTIVLPTYNEAENVRPMAKALLALELPDLDILIVDDESPDGTGRIADQLATEYPSQVHVLHRTGKRGLGRAYVEGFRWALRHGAAAGAAAGATAEAEPSGSAEAEAPGSAEAEAPASAVVQMDCDFSHAPRDVPRLLAPLSEYDVVIGSRYVEGGAVDEDWELGRELLSWWANLYTRLILRCPIRDITAGFKAWRRETLEGIDLDSIRSEGYIFQVEMAYVASRLGYRALEVPIYFEDRHVGESKMTTPVKVEAALGVWRIWWRHRHLRASDRRIA